MKNCLLIFLHILVLTGVALSQQINIPIRVTDGINSDTLWFGLDPTATNGIDPHLNESELPPIPPTGIFDARFIGTGIGIDIGEGLKRDYRSGSTNTVGSRLHRITYKTGSESSGTIRLNWWNIDPRITVRLQDVVVGFLIDTTFTGTGSYLISNPLGFNALNFTAIYNLASPPSNYNIKLIPEGLYNVSSNSLNLKDSARIFLRRSFSPYAIVDSAKSTIDSLSQSGTFVFANAETGTYYIVVRYRNGIETWSKSGGESFIRGTTMNYDFTTSSSQAYGNNLKLKGSKYCIFSGDSNQDGSINASDKNLIVSKLGQNGYLAEDLNGSNFINAIDRSIAVMNTGIVKITP